jgi:CheY-like chemotaxis protein
MPQGGDIKIRTFKQDNYVFVSIEDTGVGIPDDKKDSIFDPFFTTKGPQSRGLGLSVAYGIINRHRGTIKVDSITDQGTAFTIKLPLSKKTVEAKIIKPIPEEERKARILVIEDEVDMRELLKDILTDKGHKVETVSNGMEGVKLFEKKKFDLVFTDLVMPRMSGWEVAEKIKGINKDAPVFLITGWDVELKDSEMKENGVDFFIKKPFNMDHIFNVIQEGMTLRTQFKGA